MHASPSPSGPAKKPYVKPSLKTHGGVAELTQAHTRKVHDNRRKGPPSHLGPVR